MPLAYQIFCRERLENSFFAKGKFKTVSKRENRKGIKMSKNTKHPEYLPMTNDVIFHAVFTHNRIALKGLVCSVLHLKEDEVQDLYLSSTDETPNYSDGKEYLR